MRGKSSKRESIVGGSGRVRRDIVDSRVGDRVGDEQGGEGMGKRGAEGRECKV